MPNIEPLSSVDAAWLGMEDPTNLMMVSGILTFESPIDFAYFKKFIRVKLLQFDRFRQRVVQPRMPISSPYWEDDPNFNLDSHIHLVGLPAPGDKAALQDLASDLLSTPLDFSKPLWQFHFVENYEDGCAVICRLHHCIADGMALMSVLLSMTDLSPDAEIIFDEDASGTKSSEKGNGRSSTLGALAKKTSSMFNTARNLTGRVLDEGIEVVSNPSHLVDLAIEGTDLSLAVGRLVLRQSDPKTLFKGQLGVAKRGVWTDPIALDDVKAIKKITGTTVNDVLVAAMTGGLRRYMASKGHPVSGVDFRAAVPVNLRKPEEMGELGNKFGLVFLTMPISVRGSLDRLYEVHNRMANLKNSPEALAALGILGTLGLSPTEVQSAVVQMFAAKATAVMTNVPGPPLPLYMCGSRLTSLMFWVPQAGRVSLGISIISYNNQVWMGIATDAGLIPDPEAIIDGFYEEFDELMRVSFNAQAVAEAKRAAQEKAAKYAEEEEEEDVVEENKAEVPTAVGVSTSTTPSTEDDPDRCQGITKSGNRCRNRAIDRSDYCTVHQPETENTPA